MWIFGLGVGAQIPGNLNLKNGVDNTFQPFQCGFQGHLQNYPGFLLRICNAETCNF
jgi:hypothetical protein